MSSIITKASIKELSITDLLGTPVPHVEVTQAAKTPRVLLTEAEKKAKRNEAQRVLRSTPEGRAYANEASKKSIALKKAKIAAELEALKALVAVIVPQEVIEEVVAEVAIEEAVTAAPIKAAKKLSKKAIAEALANAEVAPL